MPSTPVDAALGKRLETADIQTAADYLYTLKRLEPGTDARTLAIGEGAAVLMGKRFPINRAGGFEFSGFEGTDLARLEAAFSSLGLRPRLSFCPLGDSALLAGLVKRGYGVRAFSNLYLRSLEGMLAYTPPPVLTIAVAEREVDWVQASMVAWRLKGRPEQLLFARVARLRPAATSLIAYSRGRPVAVAAMRIRQDLALLNGGATAPAWRGRGVQSALIAHRLGLAREMGCTSAMVTTTPGGTSARNLERLGFELAYTRVVLERQDTAAP